MANQAKKNRRAKAPEGYDLPPAAIEAEQGTLGAILLDPPAGLRLTRDRYQITPAAFYDLRHEAIFETLLELDAEKTGIDVITLQQRLKNKKLLDQVGGIAYLSSLADAVPSAVNLPYYVEILLEELRKRRILLFGQDLRTKVSEGADHVTILGLVREFERNQEEIGSNAPLGERLTPAYLRGYDVEHDPNNVLGNRWLTKRGKILIAGPSGIGKSTLLASWAIRFALGESVYGIRPVRPLVQWVVQAENDEGDLSEMQRGAEGSLGLNAFNQVELDQIEENLVFYKCAGKVGPKFLSALKSELIRAKVRPDIVWIDPLVAFVEKDLRYQETSAEFIRAGLDGIAEETDVAWIINHHTPKPSESNRDREGWNANDYQFLAAGSFDITAAARGVVVLQGVDDNHLRCIFSKRGEKAGAHHPNGEPTREVWLKKSTAGQTWEHIDPPAPPEGGQEDEDAFPETRTRRQAKGGRKSALDGLPWMSLWERLPAEGVRMKDLLANVEDFANANSRDPSPSAIKRHIANQVEIGNLVKKRGLYYARQRTNQPSIESVLDGLGTPPDHDDPFNI